MSTTTLPEPITPTSLHGFGTTVPELPVPPPPEPTFHVQNSMSYAPNPEFRSIWTNTNPPCPPAPAAELLVVT